MKRARKNYFHSLKEFLILIGVGAFSVQAEPVPLNPASLEPGAELHRLVAHYTVKPTAENLEPIKSLVNAGTEINAESASGWSSVQLLLLNFSPEKFEAIKILVKAGAELFNKDPEGLTPLYRLSLEPDSVEKFKAIKLFIKNGAFDETVADSLSETVSDPELEQLLSSFTPTFKNLFFQNACLDKKIINYIRLNAENKKVVFRIKKGTGYENLHLEYKKHVSMFSKVEDCNQKHRQLQAALERNRKHGSPLKITFWDSWHTSAHLSLEERQTADR